jgi:1-acyl-sn-glycerol-3-phosphate acyltransferase
MAQAPILPCAVQNTIRGWPRGSKPRPARIAVHFGELIDSSAEDAMERTWSSIASMLGQEQTGSLDETRSSECSADSADADSRQDTQKNTAVTSEGDAAP